MEKPGKPLVSIVTICFNAEKTIERTLLSVIEQTYDAIEYIIVDGKSIDSTMDIINRHKDRIDMVISEEDEGLYDAMNKGIAHSHGEIIGIINADDWYEKSTVEQVVNIWLEERQRPDVISGLINVFEGDKYIYHSTRKKMESIWEEMPVSHPATFICKRAYYKFGLYSLDYRIAADYELIFRMYIGGAVFFLANDVWANFRIGGVSSQKKKILLGEDKDIIQKYMPYSNNPQMAIDSIRQKRQQELFFESEKDNFVKVLKYYFIDVKEGFYVFGCGYWGIEIIRMLKKFGIPVLGIVDNNRTIWGNEIEEYKILSPNRIAEHPGKVIIAMSKHANEVVEQINRIKNERIACVTLKEIWGLLEKYEGNKK